MEGPLCYWGSDWWKGTGDSSSLAHGYCSRRPPELQPRVTPPRFRKAERVFPAPGGLGGLCPPSVDAMGARPIAGAPPILLKNSSQDRKSTRLNSSHLYISYAVFCLKNKKT